MTTSTTTKIITNILIGLVLLVGIPYIFNIGYPFVAIILAIITVPIFVKRLFSFIKNIS
jgi:hypothetical protein